MPRFQQIEHIVTAGQGSLWIARDAETDGRAVLKYLKKSGNDTIDETAAQRFEREVRTQSQLAHHNIMPILAYDFAANPPWYAMPLADLTLARSLEAGLPMPVAVIYEVMTAVFDAVEIAHRRSIIHRDLTPANILRLTECNGESRWVVADFGLCRDVRSSSRVITHTSAAVGSWQYMAPEQFADAHRVGFTADIYSLGCIIYHCLTGAPPGYRELWYDNVPNAFRAVVEKATAQARSDRYTGVRGLRSDFERVVVPANRTEALEAVDPSGEELVSAVRYWLEPWAKLSADVHDLSSDQLTDLVQLLLVELGYRITKGGTSRDAHVSFCVEDSTLGTIPVKLGRHRYFAPSTDVHQLVAALRSNDFQRGIIVTTGTLSKEAQLAAEADRRVVVIEGPMLSSMIERTVVSYSTDTDG